MRFESFLRCQSKLLCKWQSSCVTRDKCQRDATARRARSGSRYFYSNSSLFRSIEAISRLVDTEGFVCTVRVNAILRSIAQGRDYLKLVIGKKKETWKKIEISVSKYSEQSEMSRNVIWRQLYMCVHVCARGYACACVRAHVCVCVCDF